MAIKFQNIQAFFSDFFGNKKEQSAQETSVWCTTSPKWTGDNKIELLSPNNSDLAPPAHVTVQEIISNSAKFPRKMPVESVQCHQLLTKEIPGEVLERNVNSTYPVIHEHALYLCAMFLTHQKRFGNREFYKNMSLLDLIDRLLSKRAVAFLGPHDTYMLLDGTEGADGWEKVGTPDETPPLILEDCLSYDEMKLSALLSISSHTVFINDGNRRNRGVFEEDRKKLEEDGVIIGLIGTRLTRRFVMEFREIMKTKEQNTQLYGYGQFFVPTLQGSVINFYGDASLTYDERLPKMKKSERFVHLRNGEYFDKLLYSRRIILSIDTLLIEANNRAKEANKMAYVHVVGIGLGVWKIYEGQDKLFMDTFADRLALLSDALTHISDVCFAFIKHKMAGPYKHGDVLGRVKLHMVDKGGPHVKLQGEDSGKLLVVSYAWDSNSLPGNEFWFGSLDTSSDPAAACSTQVAELHNWHVNPRVSGGALRVATLKGLVTFQEYQKLHEGDWEEEGKNEQRVV